MIIKVHRCGICGTDLSMTQGGMWDFGPGAQFGHEYAGEIIEVGRNVTGFRVGERIAVLPSVACGECDGCRSSRQQRAVPGDARHRDGRASPSWPRCRPASPPSCPSRSRMADGALIEPLAISLYGVKLAQIQPGDRVLVLGGGTVALYAIYWARRLGRRADRRHVALGRGARTCASRWAPTPSSPTATTRSAR